MVKVLEKHDHIILHDSPTVSDDQALVSSRLCQGAVLEVGRGNYAFIPDASMFVSFSISKASQR